jgi:hypothetical protein
MNSDNLKYVLRHALRNSASCWSLAEPETLNRESQAMILGHRRWPSADGRLLFHEYVRGVEQQIPGAEPA